MKKTFMIYNLNGIISKNPPKEGFWFYESHNEVCFNKNEHIYDIENSCIGLYNLLTEKVFGSAQYYYSIMPNIPEWILLGGIDSDIKISKEEFETLINKSGNKELCNQLLYFYDCRNLIATLQNSVIETNYLLGQFYKILNSNSFLLNVPPISSEGIQFASGVIVTNIISILNYLFINLYSQLDFITKLAYEFEYLITDFSTYPNMKSAKLLFGDKKKLKINEMSGSLFEQSETIKMIITIRNEIVHNASIDNMPKVYQVIKNNEIVEKFIFLPDFENGIIKSYKNRKRFYDTEVKLNEQLPGLVTEFWKRLEVSLKTIK